MQEEGDFWNPRVSNKYGEIATCRISRCYSEQGMVCMANKTQRYHDEWVGRKDNSIYINIHPLLACLPLHGPRKWCLKRITLPPIWFLSQPQPVWDLSFREYLPLTESGLSYGIKRIVLPVKTANQCLRHWPSMVWLPTHHLRCTRWKQHQNCWANFPISPWFRCTMLWNLHCLGFLPAVHTGHAMFWKASRMIWKRWGMPSPSLCCPHRPHHRQWFLTLCWRPLLCPPETLCRQHQPPTIPPIQIPAVIRPRPCRSQEQHKRLGIAPHNVSPVESTIGAINAYHISRLAHTRTGNFFFPVLVVVIPDTEQQYHRCVDSRDRGMKKKCLSVNLW